MTTSRVAPSPLVNDLYQLTMAYGYWKERKHEDRAVFDYFFRRCPFGGEFAVFAGLADLLDFVAGFRFRPDEIDYLRTGPLASADPAFFAWLAGVDFRGVKIWAHREGSTIFPRVPIVRVEGPLAVAQLLETPLLYIANFACLMTTNAVRYRLAAGADKRLLEFGLRRAQDALRASYYAYLGGFDGTSHVEVARTLGIAPSGTMGHSFVSAFSSLEDLRTRSLTGADGGTRDFLDLVLKFRDELGWRHTNDGELAAFTAYAQAFPRSFIALVDTYDTLKSGVPNFSCVALALKELGYQPLGIRIDSGDLAYLSRQARRMFLEIAATVPERDWLARSAIGASNDINEATLWSLRQQGHEIDVFGIGTHLVTCDGQPAFGGVYKLVEVNGQSRIKLSNDAAKVTIPGRKEAYRLVRGDGKAYLDLMVAVGAPPPQAGERVLCRHPFEEAMRVYVIPSHVQPLHELVWDGGTVRPTRAPEEIRTFVREQIQLLRDDHVRQINPTPYKVSVSEDLYAYLHRLWMQQAPISVVR
jgi:nicotinate phosphoribosyltransferase